MKNIHLMILITACMFGTLIVAGCVAPPEETAASGPTDLYDPNQFATSTTVPGQNPGLLADATPFQTIVTPTMGYNVLQTETAIPDNLVCLIDLAVLNSTVEFNRTAKAINLKNPPLYINYTITKTYNVTGTKISTDRSGSKKEITTSYSYYSPYSFFEITVRNPTTGEIYQQDGFGKDHGYMLNKTIQVSKSGNLLIELSGFNTTPTVGFWIKPSDNLNTDLVNISTLECKSQDYVKRLNQ